MNLSHFILCSDLDRTLIPNGAQAESPQARVRFAEFIRQTGLRLVYVSGRRLDLLQAAISEFQLPQPLAAIGDVGGSIYRLADGQWQCDSEWEKHILSAWQAVSHRDIIAALQNLSDIRLQESEAQAPFKISYYTAHNVARDALFAEVRHKLEALALQANLIWSVDEEKRCGLLDVMPPAASKLHAIHYLAKQQGVDLSQCFFSGDSGNDLSVICDGSVNSILVKNAPEVVKQEAEAALAEKGLAQRLYIAQGGYQDMNGNYAAGVLEGLEYYLSL